MFLWWPHLASNIRSSWSATWESKPLLRQYGALRVQWPRATRRPAAGLTPSQQQLQLDSRRVSNIGQHKESCTQHARRWARHVRRRPHAVLEHDALRPSIKGVPPLFPLQLSLTRTHSSRCKEVSPRSCTPLSLSLSVSLSTIHCITLKTSQPFNLMKPRNSVSTCWR